MPQKEKKMTLQKSIDLDEVANNKLSHLDLTNVQPVLSNT